jgi:hypothetical protein
MGLEEDFAAAAVEVSKINHMLSNDELNEVYALYKQATVGDNGDDGEPMEQDSLDKMDTSEECGDVEDIQAELYEIEECLVKVHLEQDQFYSMDTDNMGTDMEQYQCDLHADELRLVERQEKLMLKWLQHLETGDVNDIETEVKENEETDQEGESLVEEAEDEVLTCRRGEGRTLEPYYPHHYNQHFIVNPIRRKPS